MGIHIVNKGKNGEREIVNLLKDIVEQLITDYQYEPDICENLRNVIQRNQNQSAVGGGDINCFGLSIEVKRQETLSINEWWKQTTTSAARNNDRPVLIYRQNRKAWHVVMDVNLYVTADCSIWSRGQISYDDFKAFFATWVHKKVLAGEMSRV